MAYERANAGDWAMFGLHNDAMIYIGRALELALKDRLGRKRGTLEQLTQRAIDEGLFTAPALQSALAVSFTPTCGPFSPRRGVEQSGSSSGS